MSYVYTELTMRDEEEQKKQNKQSCSRIHWKKCVGWECLAYFTKVISQNMKIKACGYVCGTFGKVFWWVPPAYLASTFNLFIYLLLPSLNMSGVTILVISCQKKKSGSYSPLLPSLLARTDRRTHALSPVAPPLAFLPHCTHTHVRTQADTQHASLYTCPHSIACRKQTQ